jgi:CelD/BcsL family acetyltransferase involved in cellulose biosynthesis
MKVFFQLAREVSKKTYQEKLLDAGVPDSEEFLREMEVLAGQNRVRAYVLFDSQRPVSYLYCPVENDVLIYAYLGYDPDYVKMSVGTVLQWLAVQHLFEESCFKAFDFTEGQSEHKRLFSTHEIQCANVIFLKKTLRNRSLVYSHLVMGKLSRWLGDLLETLGVKTRIKHFIRFMR